MKKIFFVIAFGIIFLNGLSFAKPKPTEIKAAYLADTFLENSVKIQYILNLIKTTELNAVVVDIKDSGVYLDPKFQKNITFFKDNGIYVIGRIVVFQDSLLAKKKPELAVKTKSGALWYSGRKDWHRYWVDPASSAVADYNISIAKRGIDAGLDEINFDYIRFPSDGKMNDIVFPVWSGEEPKSEIMNQFFSRLQKELKAYKPDIVLSIDVFGYVYKNGRELSVGQRLEDIAKYFDVICPMAYPSHYRCNEFGFKDPNEEPFAVYDKTLKAGLSKLDKADLKPVTRPWIQDFSIRNIYGCGVPAVKYTGQMVRKEIKAVQANGIEGFMLWNAESNFTREALNGKK